MLGSGFYASQTFTVMPTGDTRRVRMGWAQVNMPGMPFTGMHFFPDGAHLANPAGGGPALLDTDCRNHQCGAKYLFVDKPDLESGIQPSFGISGQLFDVQANFTPGSASAITFNLCGVAITYTPRLPADLV
jgi:hypothetical protein